MKIAVVGLGNIGFNLYSHIKKFYPNSVIGVDINADLVKELRNQGHRVTTDYRVLTGIDVWLLAPSTGEQGENLFAALKEMLICPGALISIESTLPPGTMELVRKYLEDKGYQCGKDVFLIHVPHRVMFGVDETVCDTPRVMGAFTKACLEKGREFYGSLVPQLIEVEDVRIAELSKVVENVKRYVDVAFAQELYRYCVDHGLDFEELRLAVNSKSNVELLGTDWGIGGECLPKDMRFLRKVCPSPLLEGAAKADQEYRERIVQQVGTNQVVLVKGLTYKPGVKDLKHSRGVELVRALEAAGNIVYVEDPLFTPEELEAAGFMAFRRTEGANMEEWLVLERDKALDCKTFYS